MKHRYNLEQVRAAVRDGTLDGWLADYLGEFNPPMLEGLRRAPRYWVGPALYPLARLTRRCGPEPDMPYYQPLDAWDRQMARLAADFTTLSDMPPLICTAAGDDIHVCDGSHRLELYRQLGYDACWCLVWYNSPVSNRVSI